MLGYIIDNKLSNEEHCKYIIKKSRKTLSAIRRLSSKASKATATKVLKSVLIGRSAYAGFLYLHNKSQRKRIEIMIMKAVRVVAKKKLSDKIKNSILLKSLNVCPIETIYKRQTILEVCKWSEKWPQVFQKMSEKTRGGQNKSFRPVGIKNKTKKSFLNNMVKLWNDVNHLVTEVDTIKKKRQIKRIFR